MENKRKLNIVKLFKTAGFVYRKNFLYWFIIWIALYLPLDACNYFFGNNLFSVLNSDAVSINIGVVSYRNFVVLPLLLLPRALFNPLALAAISFVIKQTLSQKKIFLYDIFNNSILKWKKLFLACMICYLIIFATSFLILPSIYFSVAFYFAPTVIAVSQCSGLSALLISKIALTGYWFEAFSLLLIKSVLTFLFEFIIKNFLFANVEYFILSSLFYYAIGIFFEVFLVIWFFDISTAKIGLYLKKYLFPQKKDRL